MADTRLRCGRSIDDVWDHVDDLPDAHESTCPDCQEARARLIRLSNATADLRVHEVTTPALQPDPSLLGSVMGVVQAEGRRGQLLPLSDETPEQTISEQAVVGLVWAAADDVPGIRARRCRIHRAPAAAPASTQVDIHLTLATTLGTSIPQVTELLRGRVRQMVTAKTGLGVRWVDLDVEDML
jgi:hypothetical protein